MATTMINTCAEQRNDEASNSEIVNGAPAGEEMAMATNVV